MPSRWLSFALLAGVIPTWEHARQESGTAPDQAWGQRLFASRCARCHGLHGTGGTGPSLARARLRRAGDDEALFALVKYGSPGTEMPGDWTITDREIRHVAGYVRSLGRAAVVSLPGDAERGKALYAQHDCSKCHAVKGQGGTLGPDLTEVGDRRGAAHLRQVLLEPGSSKLVDSDGYFAFLIVQIATRDGLVVRGQRVSEDSFTIQLREVDGKLHSIDKANVAEMKREPEASVMPSYAQAFSAREIDDLVAYLAGLRGD
jgi:putative heme-binding domain-containing protein